MVLLVISTAVFADAVLVVKEDTPYKKRLVSTLVDKLEDQNIEVTVIDHKRGQLNGVDPTEYGAVFITNSGAQAKVRPAVMSWLRAVEANDDNVILHTTQINDWTPPVEVDSVTSASQNSNIDALTDEFVDKIMALL
jgi:hypothetical protein